MKFKKRRERERKKMMDNFPFIYSIQDSIQPTGSFNKMLVAIKKSPPLSVFIK